MTRSTTMTSSIQRPTPARTTPTTTTTTMIVYLPFYAWAANSCGMDALYPRLFKLIMMMKYRQQQQPQQRRRQQQENALSYLDRNNPVADIAADALLFAEQWIETIQTSINNNELTTTVGRLNVLKKTTAMKMAAYEKMITKRCVIIDNNKEKYGEFQDVDALWGFVSPSWMLLSTNHLDVMPLLLKKRLFLQLFATQTTVC